MKCLRLHFTRNGWKQQLLRCKRVALALRCIVIPCLIIVHYLLPFYARAGLCIAVLQLEINIRGTAPRDIGLVSCNATIAGQWACMLGLSFRNVLQLRVTIEGCSDIHCADDHYFLGWSVTTRSQDLRRFPGCQSAARFQLRSHPLPLPHADPLLPFLFYPLPHHSPSP